jgi:hypothetical protein
MHRLKDQAEQLHVDVDHTVPIVHEVKPASAETTCNTDEPWGEKHVGRSNTENGDFNTDLPTEVRVGATPPIQAQVVTPLSAQEIADRQAQRVAGMKAAVEARKFEKKNGV